MGGWDEIKMIYKTKNQKNRDFVFKRKHIDVNNECMCDDVSARFRLDQPTHEGGARAQTDIYTDVCCDRYSKILGLVSSPQVILSETSCFSCDPLYFNPLHLCARTHTHTHMTKIKKTV